MIRILNNFLILFYNPIKFFSKVKNFIIRNITHFILNSKIPIIFDNKKIFTIRNFGKITKMRADSFKVKEPETLRWIHGFEDQSLLLDIGANIGIYSLFAAYKGHFVKSIEPDALNFALLNLNIKDNSYQDKIIAYPYSIHLKANTSRLNIAEYEWGGAMSSFDRKLDWRGNTMNVKFTQGSPGISVDDFCNNTDFVPNHIKIDVDGNELLVLKGAKQTLGNSKLKSILIELYKDHSEFNECIEIIKSNNFVLSEASHSPIYDKDNLRTDKYIFIRD